VKNGGIKLKRHLKKENKPISKMYCGRSQGDKKNNAKFTTTFNTIFMENPCKLCLKYKGE